MTTNSSPTPGHPPVGFSFRNVNEFTPNLGQWSPVGDITSWARTGDAIRLNMFVPGLGLLVSFLGPRCFRVRFRPVADANYTTETSPAVVDRDLGPFRLTVQDGGDHVTADTGDMTVRIDLKPYRIQVFRGRQLLSADAHDYNLVYFPSEEAVANFLLESLFQQRSETRKPSKTAGSLRSGKSPGPHRKPLAPSFPLRQRLGRVRRGDAVLLSAVRKTSGKFSCA